MSVTYNAPKVSADHVPPCGTRRDAPVSTNLMGSLIWYFTINEMRTHCGNNIRNISVVICETDIS